MGVLQEIIMEATIKNGDVPRMLRLCLVLGKRLGHIPLVAWIQHELDGYPLASELPLYRQFRSRSFGLFENFTQKVQREIPLSYLPENLTKNYQSAERRDGVGELAHLLMAAQNKGMSALQIPWMPEVTLFHLQEMIQGAHCIRAWSEISVSELAGALDQIKSKVLGFALDIEHESPTAGDIVGTDHQLLKEEKLTQIFNNHFTGTVQNLANGSRDFTQSVTTGIQAGDLSGLLDLLRDQGLPESELDSLNDAIEVDKKDGVGAKVQKWMSDLTSHAATGAIAVGLDKVQTVVMPALMGYFKTLS